MTVNEYHTHSTYFNLLTQEATPTMPKDLHVRVGYTPYREIPEEKLKENIQKVANYAVIKIILEESEKIERSFRLRPSWNPKSNSSKPELRDRFCQQGLTSRETALCHQMQRYLRPELMGMDSSTSVRLASVKNTDCVQQILSSVEKAIGPMEREKTYAEYDNPEDALMI